MLFVSTYLGLIDHSRTDAAGFFDAITDFLQANGVDIAKMVGIATDGASVMVGRNHSESLHCSNGSNRTCS